MNTWKDLVPPEDYMRVHCESLSEFFKEIRQSKQTRNSRTRHLRDLTTKSIGYVDFLAKKWVLFSVHKIQTCGYLCPDDIDARSWEIFVSHVQRWEGRDLLFGKSL